MLDNLRIISDSVTNISVEQAIIVVDAVNRRLDDAFRSSIIRCYWRSESESGAIFTPITHTIKEGYDEPQRFEISNSPRGFISWVFENKRPLCLINIQDHINSAQSMENYFGGELITKEFLWSRYNIDCAYIFPFIINGQVRGFYILEGDRESGIRFKNENAFKYVEQIVKSFGVLLDRAYDSRQELKKRQRGVKRFLDTIREYEMPKEIFQSETKTCFIARPFKDGDCKKASEILINTLERKFHVKANIYNPQSETYIIDGIADQISNSHFCIADISQQNPNVMLEIGMMIMLDKPIIIIENKKNDLKFPFNINQRPVSKYEIDNDNDTLRLNKSGLRSLMSLEDFLERELKNISNRSEAYALALDYRRNDDHGIEKESIYSHRNFPKIM